MSKFKIKSKNLGQNKARLNAALFFKQANLQKFKWTKAKDFGVKIVFVERSTRAHTLAYVTAVLCKHCAICAQKTSR